MTVLTVISLIALSLASSPAMNFGVASAPWPTFHGNPQHTGLSPFTGPSAPVLEWKFATGTGISPSPAIAFGTIYVGGSDGNLYALNRDGRVKWSFPTGGTIDSTPAVGSNGIVYVNVHFCCNSGAGALYAINPDGSLRWMFPPVGCPTSCVDWIYGSPTLGSDGTVYIAMSINNYYGIRAIKPDGSMKWFVSTSGIVYDSPAVASDGTIYAGVDDPPGQSGFCDGGLCAVYPNGTVRWNAHIGLVLFSSPVVGSDGTIYVGTYHGNFTAVRPDGTTKWTISGTITGETSFSTAAIGPSRTIYFVANGSLYAVSPGGSVLWKFSTTSTLTPESLSVDAKGVVYAGSTDGSLYAINPDGTLSWKFSLGGSLSSSPAIDLARTMYVGSDNGNLYAIGN